MLMLISSSNMWYTFTIKQIKYFCLPFTVIIEHAELHIVSPSSITRSLLMMIWIFERIKEASRQYINHYLLQNIIKTSENSTQYGMDIWISYSVCVMRISQQCGWFTISCITLEHIYDAAIVYHHVHCVNWRHVSSFRVGGSIWNWYEWGDGVIYFTVWLRSNVLEYCVLDRRGDAF